MKRPKIKISILNKKLWDNFLRWASAASFVVTTVLAFVDLCQCVKIIIGGCFLGTLLLMFFILFIMANKMKSVTIKINNSTVNIKFGNIFEEPELKVIAFNEYFDTEVDDVIISSRTLNGKYLLEIEKSIPELDELIANDIYLKEYITDEYLERKMGKKTKYKLGSIIKRKDYLLVALTHFDDNNRANLTLQEYSDCLLNMWTEIDRIYNGQTVSLPLLGSGLTRFKDCNVSDQEILDIMLWTYRISKVRFKYPSCLNIVLDEGKKDQINLYNLKGE